MMDDAANRPEEVWTALSEELRAFLRSRVPSEFDADDVLQDVFVRVAEKVGSLRQRDRIESWVYQVARNALADFYRRRAYRLEGPVEGSVADAIDPRGENGAGNQNRAVGAWLSLMIGGLPTMLRDAVRMYEIEGRSQAEIADRLGTSLSGAKSRVQRGRRQLEELLLGSCQLELDRRGNVLACKPAEPGVYAELSCECDDDSR